MEAVSIKILMTVIYDACIWIAMKQRLEGGERLASSHTQQ